MVLDRRTFVGTALAAAGISAPARAQAFPSRPIHWIVPFAAAGNYDVTARLVGEAMARRLGQSMVIDNRPGAGGLIGVEAAINAPADGYTIVMASFTVLWVAPLMARKPSLLTAVAPISLLTTVPMVVVTPASGRFADWPAVLAQAKAAPGTVTVGHAGNGTTNHIAILRLQANERVSFNVIPYKGSGPGLTDLMGGQIDCYVDQLSTSLPHIRSGKLRALLAVSQQRLPDLPDVPTPGDLGGTGFDGGTTSGLFAPAGTPRPVVAALNAGVVAALADATVRQRLRDLGAQVRPTTPEACTAYLKNEKASVSELARTGLLKPE
jgi:tripartite-type tricarboxylate transporter receptor subunit TctC